MSVSKTLVSFFIALLVGIAACASPSKSIQHPQTKRSLSKATFAVSIELVHPLAGHQFLRVGSGFPVTKRHGLTAGHVCQVINQIQNEISQQKILNRPVVIIDDQAVGFSIIAWRFDQTRFRDDYCLIEFSETMDIEPVDMAKDLSSYESGDPVYYVKGPVGQRQIMATGVLSSVGSVISDGEGDAVNDKVILGSVSIPGASGGPIFGKDGKLIGMVVAGNGFRSITLGIRSPDLIDFVNRYLH